MSRNDITGDSLVSKAATDEYRAGLERVFGVKKPWYMKRDEQQVRCPFCGEPEVPMHDCQTPSQP